MEELGGGGESEIQGFVWLKKFVVNAVSCFARYLEINCGRELSARVESLYISPAIYNLYLFDCLVGILGTSFRQESAPPVLQDLCC